MEYLAIISLIICILLIIAEYISLYFFSRRQQRNNKIKDADTLKIFEYINAIIGAELDAQKHKLISELQEFVHNHRSRMHTLSDLSFQVLAASEENPNKQKSIAMIIHDIEPAEYYKRLLKSNNIYDKIEACQKISQYFADEEIPNLRKYIHSKNKYLAYNAVMALSRLGDEDGLYDYILKCKDNYEYSHRIIIEFLANYTGDLHHLCGLVLEACDDYIKSAVIKAIAKYRYADFATLYLEGINSKEQNLAAACIKALGALKNNQFEHDLILAANHQNWVIRSAAVKALADYPSIAVITVLKKTIQDKEWWVRYNTAKTLLKIDPNLTETETILNGYDRYAADAVKYTLYRSYMNERGDSAS